MKSSAGLLVLVFAAGAVSAWALPPIRKAQFGIRVDDCDTWRLVAAADGMNALVEEHPILSGRCDADGNIKFSAAQKTVIEDRYEQSGAHLWLLMEPGSHPYRLQPRWVTVLTVPPYSNDFGQATLAPLESMPAAPGDWHIVQSPANLTSDPKASAVHIADGHGALTLDKAQLAALDKAFASSDDRLWLVTKTSAAPMDWEWTLLEEEEKDKPDASPAQPPFISPWPAAIDPKRTAEYADWVARFVADYKRAAPAKLSGSLEDVFAGSVAKGSPAMVTLAQWNASGQLLGASSGGEISVFGEGLTAETLIARSGYAGTAGVHPAAEFSEVFAQPQFVEFSKKNPVEGIYFWLHGDELTSELGEELQKQWSVDALRIPSPGTIQRDKFPILFFVRKDGKLYLAAITRELARMMEDIHQFQMQ
jgi:hypothetical protein